MGSLAEILDITEERFKKISPPSMSFDSERGFAVQILSNNSYLARVASGHPASLQQALTNVAAIGLSLNPAKKQAYLITRTVKNDGKYESRVFLEPSYMGLCDIATSSGGIEWVQANIVYSNDKYVSNGPGEKPVHSYSAFAKIADRGDVVGAYCVAKTSTGDYLTTEMNAEQITSVRDRSEAWKAYTSGKAKSGGPWQSDFAEMAKKTVIRNAFKTWPKALVSDRLHEAVHLSNENEGFEPLVSEPSMQNANAEQKNYFDQLIESSDALGMFTFQRTVDAQVFTNLYHSFPKGQKGKYQSLVDNLLKAGTDAFNETLDAILMAIDENDSVALQEAIDGVSDDALSLMTSKLNSEQIQIYTELGE